jgi:protease YdgD
MWRVEAQERATENATKARLAAALLVICLATAAAGSAAAWQMGPAHSPGSLVEPVAVFGTDERTALPDKYKPLQEKIGLIFNTRRPMVCTAFCVAKDVIATASHCVHGTAGERPSRMADFWFARNFGAVRDYARVAGHNSGAAAQHVLAGTTSLSVRPPIDAARDWALVRLARPACAKGFLPLKVMTPEAMLAAAAADRVFQIAYHRDFTPWNPAYSRPCGVSRNFPAAAWEQVIHDFTDPQSLILHTCDTGGASSGSPILVDGADGPEVIGINVGTYVQSKVLMQEGKVKERLKANTVANTGVATAAFADRLEAFAQARILSERADVRSLQQLLAQRHQYAGPIDGAYGEALRAAIEAYEKTEGLPVTGLATAAILQRMGGSVTVERIKAAKPKTRRGKS